MHSLLTLKWDSAGRSWIHCSAAWGDLGQVVLSRFSAGVKLALCHQSQFKQFEAPVLQPSVSLSQQRCQLLHSSASMMPWKRATQRYRKGQAVQCTQHTSLLHYVSFTLRRKKGPVVFLKNKLIFEALQTKPPVVLFYSLLYIRWCTTLKDFYFSIQQLFFFHISPFKFHHHYKIFLKFSLNLPFITMSTSQSSSAAQECQIPDTALQEGCTSWLHGIFGPVLFITGSSWVWKTLENVIKSKSIDSFQHNSSWQETSLSKTDFPLRQNHAISLLI